jgi:23S rRNA (adenine2503-C2)-methyltransferase
VTNECAAADGGIDGRVLAHDLDLDEWLAWCAEGGLPRFRAAQVWRWLYCQLADDWDAMTNLPAGMRQTLASRFRLDGAVCAHVEGHEDETRKLLVSLADGEQVEAVLIPAGERRTVCISSQAGCRFHCAFCASGQAGFRRNLSAGEMVGQVLAATRLWGERPTNVVFMGIGEPLDNYDPVLKAVRILNHDDGLNIGARRMTISTCGLPEGIRRLADEGLQVELSVSLHSPDEEQRSELLPVNRRYPLAELLPACDAYARKTGRIITYEYTLIRGLNDTPQHARRLSSLLSGRACRVNLIPLSPVEEFPHETSHAQAAELFVDALARAGVNATLRASKGTRVRAACGQLRYRRTDERPPASS